MNSKLAYPEITPFNGAESSQDTTLPAVSLDVLWIGCGRIRHSLDFEIDPHRMRPVTALPPLTEQIDKTYDAGTPKRSTSFPTSGPVALARGMGRAVRVAIL